MLGLPHMPWQGLRVTCGDGNECAQVDDDRELRIAREAYPLAHSEGSVARHVPGFQARRVARLVGLFGHQAPPAGDGDSVAEQVLEGPFLGSRPRARRSVA